MWQVGFVSDVALAEVEGLTPDLRDRFERLRSRIETVGLERLHEPHAKHVEGKLWELRMSGRDGIARSLYVAQVGQRVVILRTFVKKTQKLPRREIATALARLEATTKS